jgi:hypothetical protein
MFDFYEKRKLRSIVFSRAMAIGMCIIALLLFISAYNRYNAEIITRERREDRQVELMRVRDRATLLESNVTRIESERGKEDAIREQFDVAKTGEEVVIVVDKDAEARETNQPEILPLPPQKSLFERLFFW